MIYYERDLVLKITRLYICNNFILKACDNYFIFKSIS